MKYLANFRKHFSKFPVFSIRDAQVFLKQQGISKQYLYLLLHNLLKRDEIVRITKGIYTFKKDSGIASFAFSPSYHGLQDALSIHNIWEQETNPIIITPRKIRVGIRNICGAKVIVRRIKRSMFFGFETTKYSNLWLPVSDIEKTLIDFAYFNEPLNIEALKEIKRRIDNKRLSAYLRRVPKQVKRRVEKRLGNSAKKGAI